MNQNFFSRLFGSEAINLKIATLALALASVAMFVLFDQATLSILDLPTIDANLGDSSGFFHTYFLDISGVFSSFLSVLGLIVFIFSNQVLIMKFTIGKDRKKQIIKLFSLIFLFWLWISITIPLVKDYENRFLTGNSVASLTLNGDFSDAYKLVMQETKNNIAENYINSQISAYQAKYYDTENTMDLFNADITAFEMSLKEYGGVDGLIDNNVAYKLYNLSSKKDELLLLKESARKKINTTIYLILFILSLYSIAIYNIKTFQNKFMV